jgi:hypothetical protein
LEAHVLEFEIATREEGFVGLGYDGWRVFKAGCEGAAVDVVELLGKDPFIFCIVDFEL